MDFDKLVFLCGGSTCLKLADNKIRRNKRGLGSRFFDLGRDHRADNKPRSKERQNRETQIKLLHQNPFQCDKTDKITYEDKLYF